MKHAVLVFFLIAATAMAGPVEFNAALDAARKTHADEVKACKTLPVKADVEACTNRADIKLADAGKAARVKHLGVKPAAKGGAS